MKNNVSANTPNQAETIHAKHMDAALNIARRGLGNVWPNPAVGCVIVINNKVTLGKSTTFVLILDLELELELELELDKTLFKH